MLQLGIMDEATVENIRFGERVKERRAELGLSLRDLAELTELSTAFLSSLERGLANPTLASGRRIALALKTPLHRLLAGPADSELVVLKERRRQIFFPDSQVTYEILTPQLTRRMALFLVRAPSGAGNIAQHVLAEPTEECIVVMEGEIELQIAGQCYQLAAGDSIYFEDHLLEAIRSVDGEPAAYLSAVVRSGQG